MDAKTDSAKWEPVQLEILERLLIRDRMAPAPAYQETVLESRGKPCYNKPMRDVVEKISTWAVPSETDDAVWQGMTRDDQLAALQGLANHPDTTTPSDATVAEIVERTRARRATQAADDRKL